MNGCTALEADLWKVGRKDERRYGQAFRKSHRQNVWKAIAKSTAGKLAANFVGEGLEEVASDIIDPALRGITGVNSWRM